MPPIAVRLVVHGRVQGVGFRAHVVQAARRAGACGWVRNRDDGTVEAHVEGEHPAVDAVAAACEQGPRLAQVERVERHDAAPEGAEGFRHRQA